jgi:hypothetical protein
LKIRSIPLTGEVWIAAPSTHWLRPRLMATAAAGPLSNAILLAASVWVFLATSVWMSSGVPVAPDATVRPVPAYALAVVNAVMFVKNAVPLPARTEPPEERMESSDGWKVLAAAFRDRRYLGPFVSWYAAWKVPVLLAQGKRMRAGLLIADAEEADPGSRLVRWAQAKYWLSMAAWSMAAEELRGIIDGREPDPTPVIANDLAWAYVMQDDPALIEEADRLSALAFDWEPDGPLVHRTRGAVLLARGCLEQARELLTFAFENAPKRYRAVTACLLTMLHARKGERAEGQAWIEKARYCNPECYLLPRAEADLAAAHP